LTVKEAERRYAAIAIKKAVVDQVLFLLKGAMPDQDLVQQACGVVNVRKGHQVTRVFLL